ncbi:MAG: Rpn family recombination-promoting nuclease/putative transposase [Oscillospiraceae bacterium]|nr:Rpn family recombination-promoting nuclease/putative transposase [Oscillospiraceae bacterium]
MDMNIDEKRYRAHLKRLEQYRPLDDDFMRELFRDNIPLSEMVLRIITGINDLKITSQETQFDMKRLLGTRSICLDVFATDSEGRLYNLEIQRSDKGAPAKRARYHSSAMDIEFLNSGDDFEKLPITYVIFITENDILGEDRAIYHFEMRDTETSRPLNDGTHIIYVNAAYNKEDDTSDIARLMHDFRCSKANEMNFDLMAERTKYFKETNEGVRFMCRINEEMCNEARMEGRIEGRMEGRIEGRMEGRMENSIEIANGLIEMGTMNDEDIARLTKLSLEEVQALAKKIKSK